MNKRKLLVISFLIIGACNIVAKVVFDADPMPTGDVFLLAFITAWAVENDK